MTTKIGHAIRTVAIALGAGCMVLQPAFGQDEEGNTAGADTEVEPRVAGEALEEASRPATDDPVDGPVMDELDLRRTEITGNRELPKVLYIVPWQKSDPGNLLGRPVNTLLDEVLAPLDREEFIRQVDYYSDLNVPQDD